MTNGDQDTAGRVSRVLAADGGDTGAAAKEDNAKEEAIFCCPYCRRAYTLGQIHAEIYRIKEGDTAEDWLTRKIEEGQSGSEAPHGSASSDAT